LQTSSLAQDIRDGFLAARDETDHELARLGVLESQSATLTAERAVAIVREQIDSGSLWLVLVRAYRSATHSPLGPVLLEMLAPSLVAASMRLQPVPPLLTEEDIRQDLVLEALRALARGTLPRDPRWMARHITLRSTQAVARHLALEKRRQDHQVRLNEDSADQVEAAQRTRRRIPRAQNAHPCAQNVRRESTNKAADHVHMRSRGAVRTSARTAMNREDELMNTASDRQRPRRQKGGDSR